MYICVVDEVFNIIKRQKQLQYKATGQEHV